MLSSAETREIESVEEKIRLCRIALELTPPHHQGHASSLNDLAKAIKARHDLTGSEADLLEAIHIHKEALKHRMPGHPLRGVSLNNLAAALRNRQEYANSENDLVG